jgi:hypothetical protein
MKGTLLLLVVALYYYFPQKIKSTLLFLQLFILSFFVSSESRNSTKRHVLVMSLLLFSKQKAFEDKNNQPELESLSTKKCLLNLLIRLKRQKGS